MDFNANISSIRGGSVSADFAVGRGQQMGAPKKSFGDKLASGAGGTQASGTSDDQHWLSELDAVHQRLRSSTNLHEMGALLDYYATLMAIRAKRRRLVPANVAAPFVPGGAVLSAAISSVSRNDPTGAASG
jgi:hypothetical protein